MIAAAALLAAQAAPSPVSPDAARRDAFGAACRRTRGGRALILVTSLRGSRLAAGMGAGDILAAQTGGDR